MQRRDFIGSGSALIALALMSNSASASAEPHSPVPTPRAIQPITLKNIVIGAGEPKIIVSTTASHSEAVKDFVQQQAMGADILKIAAMPHDAGDVLRMMSATWEMAQRYAQRPLLTMSMGGMGALSRLAGELTGSALTFGMAGSASAPGQLDAGDLSATLAMLHSSLSSEKPA